MNPIITHVTSLELSRRLKELGVPQNTYFRWIPATGLGDAPSLMPKDARGEYPTAWDNGISAYLASELGEMLPLKYASYRFSVNQTTEVDWCCDDNKGDVSMYADTETDARAKMLIYLIENHFISVEELGK